MARNLIFHFSILKSSANLIRPTNCLNIHPIFAGIYGDIFYHHACGSRPKTFLARGIGESILRRQVDHWGIEEEIFRKLSSNSDEFVQSLRVLRAD